MGWEGLRYEFIACSKRPSLRACSVGVGGAAFAFQARGTLTAVLLHWAILLGWVVFVFALMFGVKRLFKQKFYWQQWFFWTGIVVPMIVLTHHHWK